jgi:hypothetical protein
MKANKKSFYLLVDSDELDKLSSEVDCKIKQFKPYLKRKKTLTIFGFGDACDLLK